ncbi:uncharacterized protein KZ484_010909 [Pholidichthys leucotaenia]
MFSGQRLRELVRERLAAAAEEIITEFEQITNQYEEEIDRQHRLLNMCCCSQIKIHRIDFPQQPECKEEEVLTEQQLWNLERNSVLGQEEPEVPQVKEEQEELCISQEGEQLVVKFEANAFMVTVISEEKQQGEAEPNSEQLLSHNSAGTEIQDEKGSRHVDSGSTKEEKEPKPKKRRLKTGSHSNSDDDSLTSETLCENETDVPQLHDCKEEEVLTVQQLCNQERNSSLDQEEQDAAQVKEEEEELCSNIKLAVAPKKWQNTFHTCDVNWGPRSETMSAGIPCSQVTCCVTRVRWDLPRAIGSEEIEGAAPEGGEASRPVNKEAVAFCSLARSVVEVHSLCDKLIHRGGRCMDSQLIAEMRIQAPEEGTVKGNVIPFGVCRNDPELDREIGYGPISLPKSHQLANYIPLTLRVVESLGKLSHKSLI